MKFLCPNCKAKYRVEDDKLSGRVVRMKCRQCGHAIVLRPDGGHHTESMQSVAAPHPEPPVARDTSAGASSAGTLPPIAETAEALSLGQSAESAVPAAELQVAAAPSAEHGPERQGAPASHSAAPPAAPSRTSVSPRDSHEPVEARSSRAPAAPPPPAPSRRAAKTDTSHPTSAAGAASVDASSVARRTEPVAAAPQAQKVATAPVSVAAAQGSAAQGSAAPDAAPRWTDAWHAGIGGAAVGPLEREALATRIQDGSVTAETLVWQEGLEDWRPLSSVPELAALLAAHKPRPAVVSPGEGAARAVASTPPARHGVAAHPLMLWGTLAAGVALGAALIFAAFGSGGSGSARADAAAPVVTTVAPVPTELAPPPPPVPSPEPETLPEVHVAALPSVGAGATAVAKAEKPAAAREASPTVTTKGGSLLDGFDSLGAPVAGPSARPRSGAASPGATGNSLSASQLQRTIATYQPRVKTRCWERVAASASRDAPPSARLELSITVQGDGRVTRVKASGDPKGYDGLATCIEQQVARWEFPATGGLTEVTVPFYFVAQ